MSFTIEENTRRKLAAVDHYNPLTGEGCFGTRIETPHPAGGKVLVPPAMLRDAGFRKSLSPLEFDKLRMRHDFEFWCAKCVTVKDKNSCRDIKLRLNRPQRILLAALETMRVQGKPIRVILLKARQCGGSTLIQVYMAWIQLLLRDNWHSLICAHVKDAAATIKGMMSKLTRLYPQEYLPDDVEAFRLKTFEGSRNVSRIDGRANTITICSAENQDAARGTDIAMAHLSEVAFWRKSERHDPNDIIRSVAGSVALTDHTLIALESTANGVGNFFHDEWLRAKAGVSDKVAVFVPWYEYPIYAVPVSEPEKLWNALDDYERALWDRGLTLEQIAWYHQKRKEYSSHRAMQAEYPTTDVEAFTCTDRTVFDTDGVERQRTFCRPPALTGEVQADAPKGAGALRGVHFVADSTGKLKVWSPPPKHRCRADRFLTVVDIGGRSKSSDFSVIAVLDLGEEGDEPPTVAAQWRGHTDHDLLAWKAAQIALWYHRSLLVIESNTLETEMTEGENSGFILHEIADVYPNIYYRHTLDPTTGNRTASVGFHTNRSTKPLIVNHHIAAVRDTAYRERDTEAVNELTTYERKPNGSFGAKDGYHDDILMTRCIGLFIAHELRRNAGTPITALKRPG